MTSVHAVHVGTSPAQDRKRLRLVRRVYFAVGLVVVISVSIFAYAYYSLGASSARGLTLQLVQANRYFLGGTYPNRNVTLLFEIQVDSSSLLDVNISPRFSVAGEVASIGNASFSSARVPAGGELVYNLRFSKNETTTGEISDNVTVIGIQMGGSVSSGLYSGTLQICARYQWIWNNLTGFRFDGQNCPNV